MSSDQGRQVPFNVRFVNLIALTSRVDLEIVVAECDFGIEMIDTQIKNRFGDADWRIDADRARGEISHKRRLAMLKLEDMPAREPEPDFHKRFNLAARRALPTATYDTIVNAAMKDAP